MGIIAKLFGKQALGNESGASFKTVAAVEDALRTLAADRRKAQAEINTGLANRAELLLIDDSEAQIAALEAKCDAQRLIMERCDAIEPRLMARLSELREESRREQWRGLQQRHSEATDRFIAAAREALILRAAMISIHKEASEAGFHGEARTLIEPLHLLTDEAVEHFVFHYEKYRPRVTITKPAAVKVPASPPIVEK